MTATTSVSTVQGERGLVGQTVVVIGGSAGIGFETARRARADGAEVILTGRNPERLEHAVHELGSKARGDEVDPHRRECSSAMSAVGPADVAALAVHNMTNTALTGATYNIDAASSSSRRRRPDLQEGLPACAQTSLPAARSPTTR
jgi:NAD(P)-dependent dehydrogenase (short-subunit alcohol dehydrogenase family)